jgi:hypothetical protein
MAQLERNTAKELLYSGPHIEVLIEFEQGEPRVENLSSAVDTIGSIAQSDFFTIPFPEGLMNQDSPDSNRLSVTLPETEKTDLDSSETHLDQKFTAEEIMIQRGEQ